MTALQLGTARFHPDAEARAKAEKLVADYLLTLVTPVVKGLLHRPVALRLVVLAQQVLRWARLCRRMGS